MTSTCGI